MSTSSPPSTASDAPPPLSNSGRNAAAYLRTRRRWGPLFEALVRNTGMGIYALEPAGRFALFNPQCERITGFAEALVVAASEPQPMTEPSATLAELLGVLTPSSTIWQPESGPTVRQVQLRTADGPTRWVEITNVPVGESARPPELVLGFLRDIHEQRQLQSHMARLEKLAALGELTASIAHEIRNPLAAMKLGLNALADELTPDCPAAEIAHEVSAEVNRLDRVVGRLLDFARVKESEFQPTDPMTLVDRTLGYVGNQARGRKINIHLSSADDLQPVRCDPDQLQQVLLNVILNSFHAMKAGGDLHIRVDRCNPERLPSGEPGPAVRFAIRDTGVGIPADVLHKVFDPFFSTRPGGTGLGLSVSFQIVSRHGGDIEIVSEVGQGTTVTILLPEAGPTGVGRMIAAPPTAVPGPLPSVESITDGSAVSSNEWDFEP